MKKAQSLHVSVFGLSVLLLQQVLFGSCWGTDPVEHGHHGNLNIVFGNYLLMFPEKQLRKFLDCLCSYDSHNCTIFYKPGRQNYCHGKHCFTVYNTSRSMTQGSLRTANDGVFQCDKPYFRNKKQQMSCTRLKIRTKTIDCNDVQYSGMFKWNIRSIRENNCKGCRNICWLYRNVSFSGTINGNFSERGQCEPIDIARQTSKPSVIVTKAHGLEETSPMSPHGLEETTPMSPHGLEETTPMSPHGLEETAPMSEASLVQANGTPFYVIIYSSLSCLLAALAFVLSVFLFRRYKRRNELKFNGRRVSLPDPQPYATSSTIDKGRHHESSTLSIRTGGVGNYNDSDNVFSFVEDDSQNCKVGKDADLPKSPGQRCIENCDPHAKTTGYALVKKKHSHSIYTEVDVEELSSKRSSVQIDRNLNAPANSTKIITNSYNSLPRGAIPMRSTSDHDKAQDSQIYSRLQDNRGMAGMETEHVMDTYNQAAGEFESTQVNRATKAIRKEAPTIINVTATLNGNSRACIKTPQTESEISTKNSHDKFDKFEPPNAEYFTLESVDESQTLNDHVSTLGSPKSSNDQHNVDNWETVDNSKGCVTDSSCVNDTDHVVGDEYFLLEGGAAHFGHGDNSDDDINLSSLPFWNQDWTTINSGNRNNDTYQEVNKFAWESTEYADIDEMKH